MEFERVLTYHGERLLPTGLPQLVLVSVFTVFTEYEIQTCDDIIFKFYCCRNVLDLLRLEPKCHVMK